MKLDLLDYILPSASLGPNYAAQTPTHPLYTVVRPDKYTGMSRIYFMKGKTGWPYDLWIADEKYLHHQLTEGGNTASGQSGSLWGTPKAFKRTAPNTIGLPRAPRYLWAPEFSYFGADPAFELQPPPLKWAMRFPQSETMYVMVDGFTTTPAVITHSNNKIVEVGVEFPVPAPARGDFPAGVYLKASYKRGGVDDGTGNVTFPTEEDVYHLVTLTADGKLDTAYGRVGWEQYANGVLQTSSWADKITTLVAPEPIQPEWP